MKATLPKFMNSNELRQAFIDFFKSKGHTPVASSSLVPHNDPTLLFTNAGMNQFKDTFLGLEKRDYKRAVTSQKCVRAGGKHNDLDNVGYTARHHTFFEMLGNFSFGDYFKETAIPLAWEFLTSPQWLGLPTDKLYVTVYHTDDEAFDIWHKVVGLPADRIIRIGDNKGAKFQSDNFWAMGDTGPCGPCTEVFFDHGEHIWGGLPGTAEEDGDRFVEIWNNVFMQFNRQKDGTLENLPAPSVDTGMGLERISAIMQGVHSNYEIDIFVNLMNHACQIIGMPKDTDINAEPSLKVLADHIRSVAFLIADGVIPSNEGRGYVLRRIIRRAVRHGNKLGANEAFFYKLVTPLADIMGGAYPQLIDNKTNIEQAILKEEEQFAKTLSQGLRLLSQELETLKAGDTLNGETVFKLYDTYGFPADLTADILREKDIHIDEIGFENSMNAQRQRARDAGKFGMDYNDLIQVDSATEFLGYDLLHADSEITHLYKDGKAVNELTEGDEGVLILDKTPFYAESGGQVGELGEISTPSGVFEVLDTKKSGQAFIHHGIVKMGQIHVTQTSFASVAEQVRTSSAKNHSATHLLHASLRHVFGDTVTQKGSLVSSDLLRFDFSHDKPLTNSEIEKIETIVNQQILANTPAIIEVLDIETAKNRGAMMLFGEKYGDTVRVLSMGVIDKQGKPFSIELCGGLHVARTGDIGLFKIISEQGISAGVRRIEAVTGLGALKFVQQGEKELSKLANQFKAKRHEIGDRVAQLNDKNRDLEKQLERLNQKLANIQAKELSQNIEKINDIKVLIARLDGMDSKNLRSVADDMKSKLHDGIVVLASTSNDKIALTASVGKNLTDRIKAGDIIKNLCENLGGKGGGKPDFAQGGASDINNLDKALSDIKTMIDNC
ncbi:alanyl-tRNA ligase [Moraxella macacae 0408225]|uniref:Alanine--tRNA ligase n=1 Tax=Moraxella macacae 0408225 TaxID=1230338 RepID=L2F7G6_9GAMM|nr:alanine--tRNA ligase [Moraxella macacae]ELA08403.1 alanyl-tRNA ligase [Moraxella macacae 0408225]